MFGWFVCFRFVCLGCLDFYFGLLDFGVGCFVNFVVLVSLMCFAMWFVLILWMCLF